MKIDCVVVAKTYTQLMSLFRFHAKLFNARSSAKDKLVLANGVEVYYMTWDRFETWKIGRAYIHLMDYIMNNDCFYHSGYLIPREQLRDLILKEGDDS